VERWGRDKATVSRWLSEFFNDGTINRQRRGKEKLITISTRRPTLMLTNRKKKINRADVL
jgi:hypothetical protein